MGWVGMNFFELIRSLRGRLIGESLPSEFQKVLTEHAWDLYAR